MFEETRKESPKLVFRDQNLDTARNLLRQSLRRRLQSVDRADGRRFIKARSLQRQCMLEAVSNRGKQGGQRNAKSINPSSLLKPTRPAPPPPTRNTANHDTISSFTNIQIVTASASRNIDLNHSLNGPNVNFETVAGRSTENFRSNIIRCATNGPFPFPFVAYMSCKTKISKFQMSLGIQ